MAQARLAAKAEDMHHVWADAFNAGDLERIVALYEPDAVLIPAPGQVARGTSEIRAAYQQFLAGKFRAAIEEETAIEAGGIALTSCRWKMTGTGPDGRPAEITGTASEVLRRQADGRWLYAIDNPFAA